MNKQNLKILLKILVVPLCVFSMLFVFLAPMAYAKPAGIQLPQEEVQQEGAPVITAYGETWTHDEYILAQIIFREAGNQDCIGQLAVAQVVINRVKRGKRGNTIEEVIMMPHQFTPTDNKRRFLLTLPTLKELVHARATLNEYDREKAGLPRIMPQVIADDVMYFNGKRGKNHFYSLRGRHRSYVRLPDIGVCDYCRALEAVTHLNLDGAVQATPAAQ